MAPTDAELETLRQEYRASVGDLTFNCRSIITNLTIIAQENSHAASVIVQVIEDQIRNAPPKQKLPVFYLLDSICKNLGAVYTKQFSQNLIRTYLVAFDAMENEEKQRLQKVLMTWWNHPGGPLFPPTLLHQLDSAVKQLSLGRGAVGQHIHVNPIFVPRRNGQYPQSSIEHKEPFSSQHDRNYPAERSQARTDYQSHYREAPRPHIGTELVVTRPLPPVVPVMNAATIAIEQQIQMLLLQKQQMAALNPLSRVDNEQVVICSQLLKVVQSTALDALTVERIKEKLLQISPPNAPVLPIPTPETPLSVPLSIPPLANPFAAAVSIPPLVNPLVQPAFSAGAFGILPPISQVYGTNAPVSLDSLIGLGLLSGTVTTTPPNPIVAPRMPTVPSSSFPRILLTNQGVNQKVTGLVAFLYESLEIQCAQCGSRYARTDTGKERNSEHLDWHFRQNKRIKEKDKRAMSREWYLAGEAWVTELETDFLVKSSHAPTSFFENKEKVTEKPVEEKSHDVPTDGLQNATCGICNETLKTFFDEDQEEWMFRNAVRVNNKLFHCTCHRDHQSLPDGVAITSPPGLKPPTSATSTPPISGSNAGKRKRDGEDDVANLSSQRGASPFGSDARPFGFVKPDPDGDTRREDAPSMLPITTSGPYTKNLSSQGLPLLSPATLEAVSSAIMVPRASGSLGSSGIVPLADGSSSSGNGGDGYRDAKRQLIALFRPTILIHLASF
ncbi:hypothetical protein BJ742DRAFT_834613 [Cladochytrium replicatum]|nr:hypothetical protein BJ742DRAFT_834613 [Cladochytrium replicatum]